MSIASTLRHDVSTCPALDMPSGATNSQSARLAAWQVLCRPRIALMSAISVTVGFVLASVTGVAWSSLIWSVAGVVCFVAASSILNQVLERSTDSLMFRTRLRPLVTEAISVREAVGLGAACAVGGFVILALFVNMTTALSSLTTMLIYVCAYTPMKSRSSLCTTVGAIPGAMPPVLGWLAAGGSFGIEPLALFAIFFVWQFPHFLAIAWIYRDQYQQAGLRMLPSFTDQGRRAGLIAMIYAVVFIPVCCLPRYVGLAGNGYLASALILSLGYLFLTARFSFHRTESAARRLMAGSLICLPVLLLSLVLDFLRLTS